ncbi:hypothetical protein KDL29_02525 [bacterium]|nr:hypothetical protein [bacterium]
MFGKGIAALAAIFVLTVAASCGGGMQMTEMDAQPGQLSSPAMQQYASALPAPSAVDKGASEVSQQRWRYGNEYLLDFNSGENLHEKLDQLLMQPKYNDVQGVAWAGYRFWLPDYQNEDRVVVDISATGEPTPGTLYLGLANWETDRWDFFGVPESGDVETGALADYIRFSDDLLLAVLLGDGQDDTAINSIRVGGELELTAVLTSDMAIGLAPTAITLNGIDSVAYGGDVMKYEFDPLGDGNWIDNGADPDLVQFYLNPGYYMAGLRITDDLDNIAYDYLPVIVQDVAGYDEVEDNDDVEHAQQLQASWMSGFKGNWGNDGVHGDDYDVFSFELQQSASIDFGLSLSDFGARLMLYRSFNNGSDIEPVRTTEIKGLLKEMHGSLDPGQYYLVVDSPFGGDGMDIDYTLSLDMSLSEAPVVIIEDYQMEVASGAALAFSIDNSYDPDGSISIWSVDLNGDGHFEVNSGGSGSFLFDAPKRPGHFLGTARVVDNTGIAATKQFELIVTGETDHNHIESEPNNDYDEMDELPLFDFGKLLGEVGGDINGPDMQDYYSFSTQVSGSIEFDLDVIDELFGEVSLYLVRWNGAEWDFVKQLNTGMDGVLTTGAFTPAGDYALLVTALEGSSRYYINGSFSPDF